MVICVVIPKQDFHFFLLSIFLLFSVIYKNLFLVLDKKKAGWPARLGGLFWDQDGLGRWFGSLERDPAKHNKEEPTMSAVVIVVVVFLANASTGCSETSTHIVTCQMYRWPRHPTVRSDAECKKRLALQRLATKDVTNATQDLYGELFLHMATRGKMCVRWVGRHRRLDTVALFPVQESQDRDCKIKKISFSFFY